MPSLLLPYSRTQLAIIAETMRSERGWPAWVTCLLLETA